MKFGKRLRSFIKSTPVDDEMQFHFIDYQRLKRLAKTLPKAPFRIAGNAALPEYESDEWCSIIPPRQKLLPLPPPPPLHKQRHGSGVSNPCKEDPVFLDAVLVEVRKASAFFMNSEQVLRLRVERLRFGLRQLMDNGWTASQADMARAALKQACVNVLRDCTCLLQFADLNYEAARKVLKKRAKKTQMRHVMDAFVHDVLEPQPFVKYPSVSVRYHATNTIYQDAERLVFAPASASPQRRRKGRATAAAAAAAAATRAAAAAATRAAAAAAATGGRAGRGVVAAAKSGVASSSNAAANAADDSDAAVQFLLSLRSAAAAAAAAEEASVGGGGGAAAGPAAPSARNSNSSSSSSSERNKARGSSSGGGSGGSTERKGKRSLSSSNDGRNNAVIRKPTAAAGGAERPAAKRRRTTSPLQVCGGSALEARSAVNASGPAQARSFAVVPEMARPPPMFLPAVRSQHPLSPQLRQQQPQPQLLQQEEQQQLLQQQQQQHERHQRLWRMWRDADALERRLESQATLVQQRALTPGMEVNGTWSQHEQQQQQQRALPLQLPIPVAQVSFHFHQSPQRRTPLEQQQQPQEPFAPAALPSLASLGIDPRTLSCRGRSNEASWGPLPFGHGTVR